MRSKPCSICGKQDHIKPICPENLEESRNCIQNAIAKAVKRSSLGFVAVSHGGSPNIREEETVDSKAAVDNDVISGDEFDLSRNYDGGREFYGEISDNEQEIALSEAAESEWTIRRLM